MFSFCISPKQIDCIDSQVSDTNKKYGEMQIRIKQTFSDLQRALAIREQDLLEKVRERKESFNREKKTRRAKLEKLRTILAAHTERVEKLIASAPDRALLAMMNNLKSRLNDLESEKPASELDDRVNIGDIHFSECMVNSVKKLIEEMGELTDSPPEQVLPNWYAKSKGFYLHDLCLSLLHFVVLFCCLLAQELFSSSDSQGFW